METLVKVGPIGGGGDPKDINEQPRSLRKIVIWSSKDGNGTGGVISGIRFTYVDIYGNKKDTDVWGTALHPPNGQLHEIEIETGHQEHVEKIEGTISCTPDGKRVVSSLTVTTNKTKEHGPFGDPTKGDPFSVLNAVVLGFFARTDAYLSALGFYLRRPTTN